MPVYKGLLAQISYVGSERRAQVDVKVIGDIYDRKVTGEG
jgi:hypothetical protein